MDHLSLTGIILGSLLGAYFLLFAVLTFIERRTKKGKPIFKNDPTLPRKVVGVFAFILGILMLGMSMFWIVGEASLVNPFLTLATHFGLMLLASGALITSSIALLRGWRGCAAMFMVAIGLLLFSVVWALPQYGRLGHPFLMNGVAVVLVVVGAYFVGIPFAWEHFVLRLDKEKKSKK